MITAVLFTYNEEKQVAEAMKSAKLLTDTIIVIDSESTDQTVRIAQAHGASVHSFPHSKYVEPAREFGIKKVSTDWVFILDADERITDELAGEIKTVLSSSLGFTYFKVPRKEYFAKKIWLKHGGWWPNYQIRLIYTPSFKTWPSVIHATPQIDGTFGYLKSPLIHYSKNSYESIVKKTVIFEDIESDLLYQAHRSASIPLFFRKFLGEWTRRMLINLGFLDGTIGIIESIYQAFSKTITYLYLYEKKKSRSV